MTQKEEVKTRREIVKEVIEKRVQLTLNKEFKRITSEEELEKVAEDIRRNLWKHFEEHFDLSDE